MTLNQEQLEETVRAVGAEVTRRLETDADSDSTPEQERSRARRLARVVLDERAGRALSAGQTVLAPETEQDIQRRVVARVCGLGPLEELLEDPEIENINLTGTAVWVRYADGTRAQLDPIVDTPDELVSLIRRIAADSPAGERRFDAAAPILDMPLSDGSRLNAVLDVAHQPAVSIRRHRYRTTGLGQLRRLGTLEPVVEKLLSAVVRARRNIVISGGTGAGKTTLLRALAAEIPAQERVVTIEDVPELALERDVQAHPDAVALHARPANTEGKGEITVADLVRAALRMSPDRVIVGETRGSETVPLLTAMSQGNDGSLTTLHAASSAGAFAKFGAYAALSSERLPLEATSLLVGSAVHMVVHLDATPQGERRVSSVREVVGSDGAQVLSNEIYRSDGQGAAPPSPHTTHALQEHGFDPALLMGEAAWNGHRP